MVKRSIFFVDFHQSICYYNKVIYEAEAIRHSPNTMKYEVNIENSIRMVFAVRFFYSLGGERY